MFDPADWVAQDFLDEPAVGVGQRRVITMTIPAGAAVYLTQGYYFNNDSVLHTMQAMWTPAAGAGNAARIAALNAAAGAAIMLIPHSGLSSTVIGPGLLLMGPGDFTFDDGTANATAVTMEYQLIWLQAKFDAELADAILPVGATV